MTWQFLAWAKVHCGGWFMGDRPHPWLWEPEARSPSVSSFEGSDDESMRQLVVDLADRS